DQKPNPALQGPSAISKSMRNMPRRWSGLALAAWNAPTVAQRNPGWPLNKPSSSGNAHPRPATRAAPQAGRPCCQPRICRNGFFMRLRRARTSGHFAGHFGGVAIGHAGYEIDHADKRLVEWPIRIRSIGAEQIEDAPVLERRRAAAVLLQRGAAKRVQQDFQGGIRPYLVQR